MNKQEFMDELRKTLSGEVTDQVCRETCRYYEDYIATEIRGGRTEEEVLEELGRPSLIARSVIAAQTGDRAADMEYTEDGRTRKLYRNQEQTQKKQREKKPVVSDGRPWYAKLLYVLALILLILVVFVIMKGLLAILLTFGIPLLLILGIIYLVMYFTK